jgi:hypothetical protein
MTATGSDSATADDPPLWLRAFCLLLILAGPLLFKN